MKKRRVVLISGNKRLTEQLTWQFNAKGYKHIKCYNDPVEALRVLSNEQNADIVISSIIMPKCDGMRLVGTLKKYDKCVNTAFVGILPYVSEAIIGMALKAGFDYVTALPTALESIVSTAENVLKTKTEEETDTSDEEATVLNEIDTNETEYEEYIRDILLSMGISKKHVGFNYVLSGIKLYVGCNDNKRLRITKDVYPKLASLYNTTTSSVERNMRYALCEAELTGNIETQSELFDCCCSDKSGLSNKECLIMIAEHVRMRLKK